MVVGDYESFNCGLASFNPPVRIKGSRVWKNRGIHVDKVAGHTYGGLPDLVNI
jgi:hypothetical protein